MSIERDALSRGIEGGEAPSQAGLEDTSASEVSDRPTACHPSVRVDERPDRKSTRLNSSHVAISYAVFCLKKKKEEVTALRVYDSGHAVTADSVGTARI